MARWIVAGVAVVGGRNLSRARLTASVRSARKAERSKPVEEAAGMAQSFRKSEAERQADLLEPFHSVASGGWRLHSVDDSEHHLRLVGHAGGRSAGGLA